MDPLDRDQVNYALEMLEELHPIAKTPLWVVYPALKPFRRALGCVPQMQFDENHISHNTEHEMNDLLDGQDVQRSVNIGGKQVMKRTPRSERKHFNSAEAEEDPLSQLGFGIVAYVHILYTMIWTFILFSVLMIPTMMNYRTGDNYLGDPRGGHASGMISNLGYSSVECNSTPLSLGKMTLNCAYGTIGEIMEYGLNNVDTGSPPDACINNAQNKICKPNRSSIASML